MNLIAWMPELMARLFMTRAVEAKSQILRIHLWVWLEILFRCWVWKVTLLIAQSVWRSLSSFFIWTMVAEICLHLLARLSPGRASLFASISSAMNALSGPLHGRGNVMSEFVQWLVI